MKLHPNNIKSMHTHEKRKISESAIEDKEQALELINEFFFIFHPIEAQEAIREMQGAVRSCKGYSLTTERKEELIYLSEKLETLINAAYLLRNG
jgi:hypothetical protein